MITKKQKQIILQEMIQRLDLPDSAYEKAVKRYEDLGKWFDREASKVKENHVHIYSQGSFMLGTTIRPLNESEEYDLDLGCKLREGITADTFTQESLKSLIGEELESYRNARGIKEKLIPKHRCWRLEYQDEISFHLDIVPCIPAKEETKSYIFESIREFGTNDFLAISISNLAVSITDDRHKEYKNISSDWNISNPEGYAKWFESKMNQSMDKVLLERAQIDQIPLFKRKTPLQRCIQLLKRHRDQMFEDDESKPISIIITTLAARAYNGEDDLEVALNNILLKMSSMINSDSPRIPNPVNPKEDFTDRWDMHDCRHLKLEENFMQWLKQAQIDFQAITSTNDTDFIVEMIERKFSLNINSEILANQMGVNKEMITTLPSKIHVISQPIKPWKIL